MRDEGAVAGGPSWPHHSWVFYAFRGRGLGRISTVPSKEGIPVPTRGGESPASQHGSSGRCPPPALLLSPAASPAPEPPPASPSSGGQARPLAAAGWAAVTTVRSQARWPRAPRAGSALPRPRKCRGGGQGPGQGRGRGRAGEPAPREDGSPRDPELSDRSAAGGRQPRGSSRSPTPFRAAAMIPPSGAREAGVDGLPEEAASAEQPPSPASSSSQESKVPRALAPRDHSSLSSPSLCPPFLCPSGARPGSRDASLV